MARVIGIDTSCYTTSVAIFDSQEGIVTEERLLLCVKEGHRGLAQSEMVYQHVRNLPYLFDKIKNEMHSIQGIGGRFLYARFSGRKRSCRDINYGISRSYFLF